MAYAEIERIGRELNGMFYAYAYSGQEHAPSMHGHSHNHHYRHDEAESSSAMLDEVAMGIESLSVSFMDELDWAQEFSSTSTTPSGKTSSSSYSPLATTPSPSAEESCSKSFYFEDWASRLIGATSSPSSCSSSMADMDLDGMKCSAVESSPQQPCKALR